MTSITVNGTTATVCLKGVSATLTMLGWFIAIIIVICMRKRLKIPEAARLIIVSNAAKSLRKNSWMLSITLFMLSKVILNKKKAPDGAFKYLFQEEEEN